MDKKLDLIELIIDDDNYDGLQAMSFVEYPAFEQNLFYFNKQNKEKFLLSKIDEQGIIVGPAMIPNKKIFRHDLFSGEEYNIYFSKETVRKASHMFLKENKQFNVTEQHKVPIKNIYLIQSWIVENEFDPLITKYGYSKEEIPVGTWAVSYKIENEDIKNKIKSGEINGLSVEAFFSEKLTNFKEEKLINKIKNILINSEKNDI